MKLLEKFIYILLFIIIIFFAYSYTSGLRFCDEDDILTGSWLISKGYVIYKDFFSHHMPLPYFVMSIPYLFTDNVSFDFFRCFFYYLVLGSSFFLLNFYTRNGLKNLWMLFYILILLMTFPLFNGYWVLADSFFAIGALTIFITVFNNPGCKFSTIGMIAIAFAIPFCVLSTLISVYPVIFLGVYYFSIRFINNNFKYSLKLLKEDLKFISIMLCPFLIWIVYMLITGSFSDFIQNGYLFNTKYYSLFNGMDTPFTLIAKHFKNIGSLFFFDKSFIEFFYKFIFLYFLMKLIFKKKYDLAVFSFFYVFLLKMRQGFHDAAYYYVIIYISVLVLKDIVKFCQNKFLKLISFLIFILLTINTVFYPYISINFYFCSKLFVNIISIFRNNPIQYNNENIVDKLLMQEDKIWAMPLEPRVYYAYKREPANKNIFYLPWQAIVPGNNEKVIEDLENKKVKLIIFYKDIDIWGYHVKSYAKPVYEYIIKNYYVYPEYNNLYFRNEYKEEFDSILTNSQTYK